MSQVKSYLFEAIASLGFAAVLLLCNQSVSLAHAPQSVRAPELYESVSVDPSGRLAIVTEDQHRILVGAAGETFCMAKVTLSPDRSAAGAVACERNSVPLHLVVYQGGKAHRFSGTLPIFDWAFLANGRQVAFGREPFHFGCGVFHELRDIASERVIDSFFRPVPCAENPNPKPVTYPEWVNELLSQR